MKIANGKNKKKIAFIANYVHYFFLFFLSCLLVYRAAFCLAIDKWLVLIKKNIAASMPTMTIYYCRAILYSKHMNQVVFIWQMITIIIIIIINRLWCTQRIESLVVAVVIYHAIRRNCLPFSTVREKKRTRMNLEPLLPQIYVHYNTTNMNLFLTFATEILRTNSV